MKIGVFDSGLGGLLIAQSIREALPEHDLVYFGDTLHVPYGPRSRTAIYELTRKTCDYLFREQDCQIILLACNTASGAALRKLQQEYLIKHFPDRRILGVIIPTLEDVSQLAHRRIGVIGTHSTINSNVYSEELGKLNPALEIFSKPTPLLVPMIENDGIKWIAPILDDYLADFKAKKIESLILGCTHYPYIAAQIQAAIGNDVQLICQNLLVPAKLKNYLTRHPEHDEKISKTGQMEFLVTDQASGYGFLAETAFKEPIRLRTVSL
ncbi:MAG: glutamate racemase [Pseudomonadota bacterium]